VANLDQCTHSIRDTLGIPCSHEISELGFDSEIPLSLIHPFWLYDLDQPIIDRASSSLNSQFSQLLGQVISAFENSSTLNQEIATRELQRIMDLLTEEE